MGLCPSRNTQKLSKTQLTQPEQPTPKASSLRATAAPYVPNEPKEPWELYLDQKKQGSKPFARRQDGTFTGGYRQLLEPSRRTHPERTPAAAGTDWVQSWKESASAPKPKPREQAKPKAKTGKSDALRDAMLRAQEKHSKADHQKLREKLAEEPPAVASDDTVLAAGGQRMVPFGLTDRHYLSDNPDAGRSHVHRSLKATPQREYAKPCATPAVNTAITDLLYTLRQLKASDPDTKRFCVGLREVMRATKEAGAIKAVIVAPDLESQTALDDKLNGLLAACKGAGIPVVFGLSRVRIGQAIKKSATISVLGIMETRGASAPYKAMLQLAAGKPPGL